MRDVIILGSTGSIGTQALDVIGRHLDEFRVVGLSAAGSNIALLVDQVAAVKASVVAVCVPGAGAALKAALKERNVGPVEILEGPDSSSILAARGADAVLNAITGYAGLESTLATLSSGSTLALANKESLVVGGRLVTEAAAPGQIVPVDSEHSAFAQCLRSGQPAEVAKLILTASGGPFRGRTREELSDVTPAQAMAHPTWAMGRVVTINSSTLVNKGLELIEAALLFGVGWDDVEVVVHPQSVIHSMVEFRDGATIAQASPPDMRLPIALGLSWPQRMGCVAAPVDWTTAASWTFEPLDAKTFPAVELAREAGRRGGTLPAVLNAANEVCVDAFCEGHLPFLGIVDTVAQVVGDWSTHVEPGVPSWEVLSLEAIGIADAWARARATDLIGCVA